MNKKTVILVIVSIVLLILVSAGVFYAAYSGIASIMQAELDNYGAEEESDALTEEVLQAIPDEDLEYEITSNIWYYTMNEDYDNEYALATELPDSQRYLYATRVFEDNFYNGGFAQFFYTYSGDFAKEAMEGYQFFGAKEHGALMARAIALYEQEQAIFEAADAEQSSNAFYKLYKQSQMSTLDEEYELLTEDAAALKVDYIRAHVNEFVTE